MNRKIRKSMFVLSAIGLFTFVIQMQAKAEPVQDEKPQSFCAYFESGNGFSGRLCGPNESAVIVKIEQMSLSLVALDEAKTLPTPDEGPQVFCADYDCENGFSGTICGPDAAAVYKKIAEICGATISECD